MKTLLLLLALLVPSPLLAAVAYVTPATGSSSANDGAVPSIGFNFDATGMNFLLACAMVRDGAGVTSFTYDTTQNLTPVATLDIVDGSANTHKLYLYSLVSPNTGSNPLDLVLDASSDGIVLGAAGFSGVDTTTPLGTPATSASAGTSDFTASVSPASDTTDLVASCFGLSGSTAGDSVVTYGTTQTQTFYDTRAGSSPQANGTWKAGATTSTTMTHDWADFLYYGLIGVAIHETAAAPSGVARRRIINQ